MESLLAHLARKERDRLEVKRIDVEKRPEAAAKIFRRELPRPGVVGEPHDVSRELVDAARVAAPDNRDDKALLGLHGEPEVVAVEVDDLVALEPGVQLGVLLERLGDRFQHGRDEQLEVDVREVALLDPGDRRNLAVRAGHVLCDQPADAAERLPATLARRSPTAY